MLKILKKKYIIINYCRAIITYIVGKSSTTNQTTVVLLKFQTDLRRLTRIITGVHDLRLYLNIR